MAWTRLTLSTAGGPFATWQTGDSVVGLYGIRTKHGGRLLSVIGGVTVADEEGDAPVMERGLSLQASVMVGDFGRAALFCTQDRALAERLLETGRGEAVGDRITLKVPFAMSPADLEVVDLSDAGPAARQVPDVPAASTVVPLHPGLAAAA